MRKALALVLTAAATTLALACGGSDKPSATTATPASTTEHNHPTTTAGAIGIEPIAVPLDGIVEFGAFDQAHVDGTVAYEQTPPVGGPHAGVWQTCQFYDVPIPSERGVHSLEHGAVWITYDPDLAGDERAAIQALADGDREVLASPFDGLPSAVVASAWGVQLQLDSALDPRLAAFAAFYENGPQTPEVGVPCAQGTTDTD